MFEPSIADVLFLVLLFPVLYTVFGTTQAGVSVRGDLTHLFNSYGVQGTKPVDVGQLAGVHLHVKIGARSLQALTAVLLHRRLAKGAVRTSNWETALTKDQVRGA